MKLIIAGLVALLLTACGNYESYPVEQSGGSNPTAQVYKVTEFEGCKLYYVRWGLEGIYVSHCNSNSRAQWRVHCGKGCSRIVAVDTEVR